MGDIPLELRGELIFLPIHRRHNNRVCFHPAGSFWWTKLLDQILKCFFWLQSLLLWHEILYFKFVVVFVCWTVSFLPDKHRPQAVNLVCDEKMSFTIVKISRIFEEFQTSFFFCGGMLLCVVSFRKKQILKKRENSGQNDRGKPIHFRKRGKGKILSSPSGNRTPVSRVTGGDTHHYTNEDWMEMMDANISHNRASLGLLCVFNRMKF